MRRLGWGWTALGVVLLVVPVAAPSGAAAGAPAWERTAPAPVLPRFGAAAVALGGAFLVFAGRPLFRCPDNASCGYGIAGADPDAALYDPAADTWLPVAPPGPVEPLSVVASDGVAYVYGWVPTPGGRNEELIPLARRPALLAYDPAVGVWTSLSLPPRDPVCLEDGAYRQGCWEPVLVDVGGQLAAIRPYRTGGPVGSVYDPVLSRWRPWPADPDLPADGFSGATWAAGRLWVLGYRGEDGFLVGLDPRSRRWTAPVPVGRCGGRPVAVADRVVWPGCGVFDPATRRYRAVSLPPRADPEPPVPAGLVVGDRVTVGGYLFDPVDRSYTRLPDPPEPTVREAAFAASETAVFRFGGSAHYYRTTADGYVLRLPERP